MTTTISIANGAGSAGKTTTAVTLAALAALGGRRTRLIDLDPQGNATRWVTTAAAVYPGTIADVLTHTHGIDQADTPTTIDGLTVIPAPAGRMDGLEAALSGTVGAEQRLRIALETATPVDLTIIDCPGSLGLLTLAGLVAADHVLTVATPSLKELAGLPRIDQLVRDVATAYRPKLALVGVVPCMVPPPNAGDLYQDSLALARQQWGELVTPTIRRTVQIPQSYAARTPLPVFEPTGGATTDYEAVLAWLTTRGALS